MWKKSKRHKQANRPGMAEPLDLRQAIASKKLGFQTVRQTSPTEPNSE
jgi:hypothetical protein